MTAHPDAAWVEQQARNFVIITADDAKAPTHLIHDLDTKFTAEFDDRLKANGIEVGPATPNLNATAERFVLSIKSDALDNFVVIGEAHLRYIIDEYIAHYHTARPHQSLDNVPPAPSDDPPPIAGKIVCNERLGGLLKEYQRAAA